jgi:hypothetical protein
MELLFIALGGAILGLIARYVFSTNRSTHGVVLVPAIGVAASAVVWVALTWLGMAWDGGWIWAITLVATAITVGIAAPVIGTLRERSDIATLVTLRSATPN